MHMSQPGQKPKKIEESKVDYFICIDDQVELLLKVTFLVKLPLRVMGNV